jgi:acetyltransferase-like isoleucine patch superfamily enzyme
MKLFITKNSTISESAKVYPLSIITNTTISDYTYVGYGCRINNTIIKKYCSIAQNVKAGLGKHALNFVSSSPIFYASKNPLKLKIVNEDLFSEFEKITIGNDVWIGTNVTVLDGVTIGDGAVIGANSVVTKNVEPYSVVGGVPARLIKKRFDDECISLLTKIQWWDYSLNDIIDSGAFECFSKPLNLEILHEISLKLRNYKAQRH